MRTVRRLGLACLAANAFCVSACSTDHNLLAQRPHPEPSASAPGDARPPSAPEAAAPDGSTTMDALPPFDATLAPDVTATDAATTGTTTLTFVHGITDSVEPIQFCFAPVRQGVESNLVGAPLPAGGLPFGTPVVVDFLEGIDWETDGFRPYVLAGDLSLLDGLDCAAAVARGFELMEQNSTGSGMSDASSGSADAGSPDAGALDGSPLEDSAGPPAPPAIRVAALPLIPERTFAQSRSYLFVPYGCMGGPAFTDPSEKSVCGEFYKPSHPTLALALVSLAGQPSPSKVGLQFLNASSNLPLIIVESTPVEASSLTTYVIASKVVTGQLVPAVPLEERDVLALGANTASAAIQVSTTYDPKPVYDEPWSSTLAAGGFDEIENGRTYTLVLVGPHPGFARREWWNGAIVTLVANAPL